MNPDTKAAHEQVKLVKALKKLLGSFTPDEIQAALVLAELVPAPVVPPAPDVVPPAPETPATPDVIPPVPPDPVPVDPAAPVAVSASVPGKERYDVWNEKTEHVKTYMEADYKGEAFKYAKEFADQHPGYTIS